jgi:GTPase SAR1 family protein
MYITNDTFTQYQKWGHHQVTAVGDSGVGKTCLLMTYATNKFPEGEVPELYEHMTIKGLFYSFFFSFLL